MVDTPPISQSVFAQNSVKIMPLGDQALLICFADILDETANKRAIAAAQLLNVEALPGVTLINANLVSVLVRYDPRETSFFGLSERVGLALSQLADTPEVDGKTHVLPSIFGGDSGPDLNEVAQMCDLTPAAFIKLHNARPLRVLATGFAPGFVYCGMHDAKLHVPRRTELHPRVTPGTILFAAGQTAITATSVPTGWHVIGHTNFNNFDIEQYPPTTLKAGDQIQFQVEEGA